MKDIVRKAKKIAATILAATLLFGVTSHAVETMREDTQGMYFVKQEWNFPTVVADAEKLNSLGNGEGEYAPTGFGVVGTGYPVRLTTFTGEGVKAELHPSANAYESINRVTGFAASFSADEEHPWKEHL